jgi:hypothetical protein
VLLQRIPQGIILLDRGLPRDTFAPLSNAPGIDQDDVDTDAWAAYELDVAVAGDYRMLALG